MYQLHTRSTHYIHSATMQTRCTQNFDRSEKITNFCKRLYTDFVFLTCTETSRRRPGRHGCTGCFHTVYTLCTVFPHKLNTNFTSWPPCSTAAGHFKDKKYWLLIISKVKTGVMLPNSINNNKHEYFSLL